jgi:hypothetical protein
MPKIEDLIIVEMNVDDIDEESFIVQGRPRTRPKRLEADVEKDWPPSHL